MQTTIDKAGRVVIPRPLRERAGLKPGTTLTLVYHDGRIEMTPAKQEVRVSRRGSRLVLSAPASTEPLTVEQVNEILQDTREERSPIGTARQR
jgi:AbrB family looped-hinge helix DNA binding protein